MVSLNDLADRPPVPLANGQVLKAGLIDVLHLAVTPIVLGQGENLWDDLRNIDLHYNAVSEGGENGVSHVTFTRRDPSDVGTS